MYVSTVLTLYIVITTILKVNISVPGCWIFFFSSEDFVTEAKLDICVRAKSLIMSDSLLPHGL